MFRVLLVPRKYMGENINAKAMSVEVSAMVREKPQIGAAQTASKSTDLQA
jgi:hypothetical protein